MNFTNFLPASTVRFIKKMFRVYLLFVAIATGGLVFCLFHFIPALAPLKPAAYFWGNEMLPVLIFSMLFLSFCKVNLRDMRPRQWHAIIYPTMFALTAGFSLYLYYNPDSTNKVLIEALIVCFITPPAAAAGVIAGKIGGNESSVVMGVLIGNLLTAVAIPLLFPLFTSKLDGTFFEEFMIIARRVFPVIVLPLILAQFIKICIKPLHRFIVQKISWFSFYIWGACLATVSGRTFSFLVNSPESAHTLVMLALIGLITTAFHFAFGKIVGNFHGQRISAGQAFGQRNGVFGLWVTLAFLEPTVVIAPGCYILWQNLMNAWQMSHREKMKAIWQKEGKKIYQE